MCFAYTTQVRGVFGGTSMASNTMVKTLDPKNYMFGSDRWTCCECSESNDYDTSPSRCPSCGHLRCDTCRDSIHMIV
ncbi:hypothetical protein A7C99_2060 [Trichophyton rubrum]|uniref:Uncharacterized protein n=1 Tax=Trichophyton rubrum TaxID=5551 RepID=A0A178F2Z5_TRIRU|nr:hypothetical protein A7C99_2060 [Trichophyton rubrum]